MNQNDMQLPETDEPTLQQRLEALNDQLPCEEDIQDMSEEEKEEFREQWPEIADEVDEILDEMKEVVETAWEHLREIFEGYERIPGENYATDITLIEPDEERTAHDVRPGGVWPADEFDVPEHSDVIIDGEGLIDESDPLDGRTTDIQGWEVVAAHEGEVMVSGTVHDYTVESDDDGPFYHAEVSDDE